MVRKKTIRSQPAARRRSAASAASSRVGDEADVDDVGVKARQARRHGLRGALKRRQQSGNCGQYAPSPPATRPTTGREGRAERCRVGRGSRVSDVFMVRASADSSGARRLPGSGASGEP